MTPLAWLRGLLARVAESFREGMYEADRRLASLGQEEED